MLILLFEAICEQYYFDVVTSAYIKQIVCASAINNADVIEPKPSDTGGMNRKKVANVD